MTHRIKKIFLTIGSIVIPNLSIHAQGLEERNSSDPLDTIAKPPKVVLRNGSPTLPDVILPSPASQEFRKYLGYPVSMATGVPEISIPLYTIDVSGFQMPLTLNYHASGIKVEQSPFPIGYGWSMFPANRISRVIFGKPDERYLNENDIKNVSQINNVSDLKFLAEMSTPTPNSYEVLPYASYKDGQYDIFTVQLPSYTGNFILRITDGQVTVKSIPIAL